MTAVAKTFFLGIEYYEKNVTNQLLEFMQYYISETVQEAKVYRDYAKKSQIDVADMRLAISAKNYDSFTRPLPIDTIKQVADLKNQTELPDIETIHSTNEDGSYITRYPKAGDAPTLPSSLPKSQEAWTLTAPNV